MQLGTVKVKISARGKLLPLLGLICISFIARAQPTVLTSDSLALVAIYNTNNGSNWTVKTNWLSGPVNTWYGVTVAAGRVSEIDLSNNALLRQLPSDLGNLTELTDLNLSSNNLFDVVPKSILNLTKLETLNLSGNQLTDLPDLSESQIVELGIADNYFLFKDIIPNLGITSVSYSPQKLFTVGAGDRFPEGDRVVISCPDSISYSGNQYIWYKNDELLPGREAIDFEFPQIGNNDLGEYKVVVSNPLLPDLELIGYGSISEVYTKQEGFFEFVNAGDLTNEGYDPGSNFQTDVNYSGQWADFNSDGYDDISVSTLSGRERSYFYVNNGDGTFRKLPNSSYHYAQGRLFAWGDYNNDGWLDAYAPGGALSMDSVQTAYIFKNRGNEMFDRIPLGVKSSVGVWSDTDNDGDLDLVVNELGGRVKLFRNDGDDIFTPLNAFEGTTSIEWILQTVDINNDFRQDFFATKDGVRDLHIAVGDNQFELDNSQSITTDIVDRPRGASFADIDNDGDYDAYLPTSSGVSLESHFYINDGSGNFMTKASTEICGFPLFGPGRGSVFFDFDNDGFVDLLTNVRTSILTSFSSWKLFKNNGNLTFSEVTGQNFRSDNSIVGASVADFDNDGFLDISSASGGVEFNGLYRNKGNSNNWLQIKLIGKYSNRSGIGSKIDVYAGGLRRHYQVIVSNGFANNNSLTAHFGLGVNSKIDSVIVRWPSGVRQKIVKPEINKKMFVHEDAQGIQTIMIEPISDKSVSDAPFNVAASASSTLPVSLSTESDIISLDGRVVTIEGSGRVVLRATQPGDSYYAAAFEEIDFCINPKKPVVSLEVGDQSTKLTSDAVNGNQWFRDDTLIEGATNPTLEIIQDGTYKVQVTTDGCKSSFSDVRGIVITGRENSSASDNIKIMPNPVRKEMTILLGNSVALKEIFLHHPDGKICGAYETTDDSISIDMDGYAPGIYLVKVLSADLLTVFKVVKD